MKKIVTTLILMSSFFYTSLFAQGFDNLHNYWQYRQRFQDHFIRIPWGTDGIGQLGVGDNGVLAEYSGYSLTGHLILSSQWNGLLLPDDLQCVISSSDLDEDGITDCFEGNTKCYRECTLSFDGFKNVFNIGADAVAHQGYYIAMLATEYALLDKYEQDTKKAKTLEELYLALQALRRLEIVGGRVIEKAYEETGVCSDAIAAGANGFFIRSDAPKSLALAFNNPYLPVGHPDRKLASDVPEEWQVAEIRSPYSCSENDISLFLGYDHDINACDKIVGNFMSQDQITGMLFGLAFVKKYIPDEEFSFPGAPDPVNVVSLAQGLANRVVGWIDSDYEGIDPTPPSLCPQQAVLGARHIRLPGCNGGNNGNPIPCVKGGDARGLYWGMVQAVNYIDPDTDLTSLDESSWNQTIFAIRNSDVGTSDNTRFYLELASIFDWNLGQDDGFSQMQEDALDQGNREAHILARWLLGNYQMGPTGQLYLSEEVQRRVETLLASAPCYGPCSGGANCKNPIGWCGSNRWIVPNRQSNCHEIHGDLKFNGVDYMLLYNLYQLVYIENSDWFDDTENIPYYDPSEPESGIEESNLFVLNQTGIFPKQGIALQSGLPPGGLVEYRNFLVPNGGTPVPNDEVDPLFIDESQLFFDTNGNGVTHTEIKDFLRYPAWTPQACVFDTDDNGTVETVPDFYLPVGTVDDPAKILWHYHTIESDVEVLSNFELIKGCASNYLPPGLAYDATCQDYGFTLVTDDNVDDFRSGFNGGLVYKALNNIILEEGFKVEAGATFLAEVGGGDVNNIECLTPEGTLNSTTIYNPNELNSTESKKLMEKVPLVTFDTISDELIKLKKPIASFLSIHPNPFSSTFDINLSLSKEAVVSVQILNSFGQIMQTVVENQYLYPGSHTWNVENNNLTKGIYYCHLTIDGKKEVRKIIKN